MDFQIAKLKEKLISAKLPVELNEKINTQLERLQLAMQTGGDSSYGY